MKLFFAFNKHPHSLPSLAQCGEWKNVWGLCENERQRETERGRKGGKETEIEKHRYRKKGNFPISSWFFQFLLGSKPNG